MLRRREDVRKGDKNEKKSRRHAVHMYSEMESAQAAPAVFVYFHDFVGCWVSCL